MSPLLIAFLVLVLTLALLVLFGAVLLLTPFALPLVARGAPFVPSGKKTVERMLDLAGVGQGTRLIDLGSGDGRIVVAAARRGAVAHGIEINPWLVWWSRWRARMAGVSGRATFRCGNLWTCDLSGYAVVTVYGLGPIMARLERKLLAELKPGARVVSHAFTFSNWQPVKVEGNVYRYEQPGKSQTSVKSQIPNHKS